MKRPKKVARSVSPQLMIGLFLSLAFVTWLALQDWVLDSEKAIIDVLYAIPEKYDIVILNITHFGSLAALYSAVFVTLIIGYKKLAVQLLTSGMLAYLSAGLLKQIILRPRPSKIWLELTAREWGPMSYGYPSGHAALVTAMAFTLWPYVKGQYRWLLVALAVLVALSRIILGVHLPLDIVGGALVGILSGYAGQFLVTKLKMKD